MVIAALGMKGNPARMQDSKLGVDGVLVSHTAPVPKVDMREHDNSFRDENEHETDQAIAEQEGERVPLGRQEQSFVQSAELKHGTAKEQAKKGQAEKGQAEQGKAEATHAQLQKKQEEALGDIGYEPPHISMAASENKSQEHPPTSLDGHVNTSTSLTEAVALSFQKGGFTIVQNFKDWADQVAKSYTHQHAPNKTAGDSVEVPSYFFGALPIHFKFTGVAGDASSIVILDRFKIVDVPWYMVYVFPIIFFVVYSLMWCVCCMRSNRTELSFRLVCEAAACFMCLWADLATKHKVITGTRAWSYVLVMVLLLIGWQIASMKAKGTDYETTVFFIFQPLIVIVWLIFAVERTFVRKFYRRTVNPMASDHACSDCAVHLCCGQFTALQEAQFMSAVNVNEMKRSAETRTPKW